MNITDTISWLEIFWTGLSVYIIIDAIFWLHYNINRIDTNKPTNAAENLADRFLLTIGYFALVEGFLNAIAGIAAMTIGPSPTTTAALEGVSLASVVIIGSLILSLAALKLLMVFLNSLYRQLVLFYIKVIAEEEAQAKYNIKRLENIADSAVQGLEDVANKKLEAEGKEHFPVMKPVTPEHHSPITQSQMTDSNYATLKARLVAIRLLLDLPLRKDD